MRTCNIVSQTPRI